MGSAPSVHRPQTEAEETLSLEDLKPTVQLTKNDGTYQIADNDKKIPTLRGLLPGLWYASPTNCRWEPTFHAQLVNPNTPLHRDFLDALSHGDHPPHFNDTQLVTLALLAQPDRTGTAADICRWIINHLVYYRDQAIEDVIQGYDLRAVYNMRLPGRVRLVLHNALMGYDTNFPLVDHYRSGQDDRYHLPPGQENHIFRSKYLITSSPDLPREAGSGPNLTSLPSEILVKILRNVLKINGKLRIGRYVSKTAAVVLKPSTLLAPLADKHSKYWTLPPNSELLASLGTNKLLHNLGREVFYSENTFVFEADDTFAWKPWLQNIGNNLRYLARVELQVELKRHYQKQKDVESAFRLLGKSERLRSLTLHINERSLPRTARRSVAFIPGFKILVKFRGITELEVISSANARRYLESHLTPWKKYERRLATQSREMTDEENVEDAEADDEGDSEDSGLDTDEDETNCYERKAILAAKVKQLFDKAREYEGPRLSRPSRRY